MPWIGAVACITFVAFSLNRFRSNFITSSVINFSMVVSGSASVTYLLDTHGGNTLHVFALINFSKNIIFYGFTFFANGLVEARGVKVSLLILAACQAFCWLLTIPMYRYGKRVRAFVSRRLAFCLFVCWPRWYWDLPPSEPRSTAGSVLVYIFILAMKYLNPWKDFLFSLVTGEFWWRIFRLNTRTSWIPAYTLCRYIHVQKTPFSYVQSYPNIHALIEEIEDKSKISINLHWQSCRRSRERKMGTINFFLLFLQ